MSFARRIFVVFLGAACTAIGLLWFLQGMHLIETQPLLCATTCQAVTEASLTWTIIGAVTLALGCGFLSVTVQKPKA